MPTTLAGLRALYAGVLPPLLTGGVTPAIRAESGTTSLLFLLLVVRVQPEDGDSCRLYCIHFVKYRHKNFTLEDIVNELTARDPKTIESELKNIYQ